MVVEQLDVILRMHAENMDKVAKSVRKPAAAVKQLTKQVDESRLGMGRFKMELLGVMFFGMALRNTFIGLIKPTMEAFGWFDIWRVSMQMLFIPTVAQLTPMIVKLSLAIAGLPEPLQLAIGYGVLFGAGLGDLLFKFGMIGLGVDSLIRTWVKYGKYLIPVLKIMGIVIGVFLILHGLIKTQKGEWEGLGEALIGVGIILIPFIGLWAAIPIAIGTALYFAIKHWDDFKLKLEKIINFIISKINVLIRALNRVPGVAISEISDVTLPEKPGGIIGPVMAASRLLSPGGGLASMAGVAIYNYFSGIMNVEEVEKIIDNKLVPEIQRNMS